MKTFIKTLKIIGNVVLWLFVVFAILVTVLVFSAQNNDDGISNIMGKSLVTVTTDSMNPTFKAGDLIVDEVLTNDEKQQCKENEIITFYTDLNGDGNDELNTHRIVEAYEEDGYTYYITKGDNKETNPVNDKTPVVSSKVVAKYTGTRLSSLGRVLNFLQTSTGFLCVVVIPLVVFFLFELYNFIVLIVKSKGSNGKVSAEEEEEIKRRAVEEYLKQQAQSNPSESKNDSDKAEPKD